MDKEKPGCWPVGEAEQRIRAHAHAETLELAYTDHAEERMEERGINVADVMYILENGHIYDEPVETERAGYCKYKICARTPSTGSRQICVVVIPHPNKPAIKVVTVMWRDLS